MINQITEQLWISDIQQARQTASADFDRIITVCQDSIADQVDCEYECYKMADGELDMYGGSSSYRLFAEACDSLVAALNSDEEVLVHCHAGESRSVAVSIAAVSVFHDTSYNTAYTMVEKKLPKANPNSTLQSHAREYIGNADSGIVATSERS